MNLLVRLAATACLSGLCFGGTFINLGVFSFDELIPSGESPGINQFIVSNLSGDPLLGGYALPPDFPVATFLPFSNVQVTLYGFPDATVSLGTVDSGFHLDSALQFPSSVQFEAARFQAELPLWFQLVDGTIVRPLKPILDFRLDPFQDGFLIPGVDSVVLAVEVEPLTTVPEPASWHCVLLSLIPYVFFAGDRAKRLSRRN